MTSAAGPDTVHLVPLDPSGRRRAMLREPAGADEQSVGGTTTADAVRLLDRLLTDDPASAVRPGDAATLTVVERDLLLAAAYRLGWGPRISGVVTCAACAAPFDLDFRLADLADRVRAEAPAGVVTLDDGVTFRLPTAQDEAAVLGLPPDEAERALLARCLISGAPETHGPRVEQAMAGAGIDLDLAATCPECGHGADIRFQIQDYLLATIRCDWATLIHDVHRIAVAYGWSLTEILSLPRGSRRAFVALLDGEPIPRTAERS
ncbi:hypothetical protein [Actinoplanes sp. CA-252034]|uniref:hypothetical protein n=1 Tax=Actinoplanes sp. CA-252034 TaxID=3239906 RepID=UPI003D990F81